MEPPARQLRQRKDGKFKPSTPPPKPPKPKKKVPKRHYKKDDDPPDAPRPEGFRMRDKHFFYSLVEMAAEAERFKMEDIPQTDLDFYLLCVSENSKNTGKGGLPEATRLAKFVFENDKFCEIVQKRLEWEEDNKGWRAELKAKKSKPEEMTMSVEFSSSSHDTAKAMVIIDKYFHKIQIDFGTVNLPAPSGTRDSEFKYMPIGGQFVLGGKKITVRGIREHAAAVFHPLTHLRNSGFSDFVVSLLTPQTCQEVMAFVADATSRPKHSYLTEAAVSNALACVYQMHREDERGGKVLCSSNLKKLLTAYVFYSGLESVYCRLCRRIKCFVVHCVEGEEAKLLRQGKIHTRAVDCVLEDCLEFAQYLRDNPEEAADLPEVVRVCNAFNPKRPAMRRLQPNKHGFIIFLGQGQPSKIADLLQNAAVEEQIQLMDATYVLVCVYFWFATGQRLGPDGRSHRKTHAVMLAFDRRERKFSVLDSSHASEGLQPADSHEYATHDGYACGAYYAREAKKGEAGPGARQSLQELQEEARQELQQAVDEEEQAHGSS